MSQSLGWITLVTGGARAGKSRHAMTLCEDDHRVTYIATAEALDDDMHRRIAHHRAERPPEWTTVEEPIALAGALRSCPDDSSVIVDCLTVWVSNLLLRDDAGVGAPESWYPADEVEDLVAALAERRRPVVVVTNEVGLGVIPPTRLGRVYRDALGKVNQRVAETAGRVVLMVAGIPLVIKGDEGLAKFRPGT